MKGNEGRSAPIVCLDMEGVIFPEIWSAIARRFSLPLLERTTRECANYEELMAFRLGILRENGLRWPDIEAVLAGMEGLPGAEAFLKTIRGRAPLVILTDSFDAFMNIAGPRLGLDAILCHRLIVDADGAITGWERRCADLKAAAIRAFASLGFSPRAAGDSLNDISMLEEAETGILFRPSPAALAAAAGRFPVVTEYDELSRALLYR